MNFRGDATPYKDLLRSIATEEMGHVELVANTINVLLEGASTPSENPEELPLSVALAHYLSTVAVPNLVGMDYHT
jgi:Mn-containing catalase